MSSIETQEQRQPSVSRPPGGSASRFVLARIAGCLLAAGAACAFYGVARLSWADYLAHGESPAQVQAALGLAPGNAGYWLHWADLLEADGRSGRTAAEHAALVDPEDAAVWMRAGMEAEARADFAAAEQNLLRAAGHSRQYAPRWALANFYFRRGDSVHFWPWVQSAMRMAYSRRDLLFDLCWRMRPDSAEILRLGIPDDPKVLRDYLGFLLNTNRPEAAIAVAGRIREKASRQDRDLLLWYVGVMFGQHRWPEALSAWNQMCTRQVVPYAPLDRTGGSTLTNGSFAVEPVNGGFDWRVEQAQGISVTHSDTPPSLRFAFDGQQPEGWTLVDQFVPVEPSRRYKLGFGFRTEGIADGTGLQWRVKDAANGADIPVERGSLSADEWAYGVRHFAVPSGVSMVRLSLVYERQPGTVRIEGSLWLKSVSLEKQP